MKVSFMSNFIVHKGNLLWDGSVSSDLRLQAKCKDTVGSEFDSRDLVFARRPGIVLCRIAAECRCFVT